MLNYSHSITSNYTKEGCIDDNQYTANINLRQANPNHMDKVVAQY